MDEAVPVNVVDRELQGWWRTDVGLYRTSGAHEAVPIERVMSRLAPLRTVEPAPEDELREARESMLVAGKHAAATVLAALAMAADELAAAFRARGVDDPEARGVAALAAGDPASARASLLPEAVAIGRRVSEIPSCVCAYARDLVADLVVGWVRRPGPFVEVLGAMANLVGSVADEHGPAGWEQVADEWLQPAVPGHRDGVVAYGLVYSASRYYRALPV